MLSATPGPEELVVVGRGGAGAGRTLDEVTNLTWLSSHVELTPGWDQLWSGLQGQRHSLD